MTDFNIIFKQVESLSLFELHRLQCAISKTLIDPVRNAEIRQHLKMGMRITYFCSEKNDLVAATIVEVRKNRVSVVNTRDGEKWDISICSINLQEIDITISPKKSSRGLDRNSLKVGERVGWHSKLGYDLYGVVEKLNPKKALIRLDHDERWTVPYSLLFLIRDGVSIQGGKRCIEGEVIR